MNKLKHQKRFDELIKKAESISTFTASNLKFANRLEGYSWFASALNLLEIVYGRDSTYFTTFQNFLKKDSIDVHTLDSLRGIFISASEEYSLGYIKSIKREIADEISMELTLLAESTLIEGHLQPAAVIASAALEEAMKQAAMSHQIDTNGNTLQANINALKSKGAFSGAEAKIVPQFNKIRNHSMHAEWDKIKETDIGTLLGFLKQFIINHG